MYRVGVYPCCYHTLKFSLNVTDLLLGQNLFHPTQSLGWKSITSLIIWNAVYMKYFSIHLLFYVFKGIWGLRNIILPSNTFILSFLFVISFLLRLRIKKKISYKCCFETLLEESASLPSNIFNAIILKFSPTEGKAWVKFDSISTFMEFTGYLFEFKSVYF